MKCRFYILLTVAFAIIGQNLFAQENNQPNPQSVARISGSLESNINFFFEDTLIGATNTPQYDRQLYGADTWLQLNYSQYGFDIGVRFDLFNNSNLLNPQGSYTAQGFGRWFIKKKVNKLGISVGYLYDQVGSGLIFRAYEQRPLLIDNALYGARLTYDLSEDWQVKAFTGLQKQQFDTYDTVIKGASLEGFVAGKKEDANWSIAPGIGIVTKTMSDAATNTVVNTIATYSITDSIGAKYNTYAFSAYNTLTAGRFSWYMEAAYKTAEVFFDPFAIKTNRDGSTSPGKLVNRDGTIFYTSMSYAAKGFGISVEGKRTENFTFRTNPFVSLNRGMINFLPPMTRVNTYRLTARYASATQELGELSYQIDARYKASKKLSFNVNFSSSSDLDGLTLYRELFTEVVYKQKRKWTLTGGIQLQNYNQERFETKPGAPIVETVTPYVEFLYKFSRKKSLRLEAQYMSTEEDFGSWLFGLAEMSFAPHWTMTASTMYNISPTKRTNFNDIIYPRFDVFYTVKANRFSLSYVKQVEGIVCSGGICRLEPAFSGVKMSVNSTF